ncbi:MAG: hypothetical protein AAF331_12665, partial [Pseudomonadota bacterium]
KGKADPRRPSLRRQTGPAVAVESKPAPPPAEKDPETGAVKLWRFQSKAHLDAQEQRRAARKQARPNAIQKGSRKKQDRQHSKRPHHGGGQRRHQRREPDPDSPFAVLGALLPDKPKPKPKKKRKPKPVKQQAASPEAATEPVATPEPPPDKTAADTSTSDE